MTSRATATLTGLALGDALGMPSQSMSPADITRHYGTITTLRDAVIEQPIAPGMAAGSVTDDTEQALLLAELITADRVTPMNLAGSLLAWEDSMIARGSADLLGPSTKMALAAVRGGADPATTGKTGTTNGAAMRIAPVGIAHSLADIERFADAVYETLSITHDTTNGWQSAFIVAAAVSAGIDGASARESISQALDLTESVPTRGAWTPKAGVLARSRAALDGLPGATELPDYLRSVVGTSVEANESIPAALALCWAYGEEPMEALTTAANLGGDTDTIGAIAGAILGATGAEFGDIVGDLRLGDVCLDDVAKRLMKVRRG